MVMNEAFVSQSHPRGVVKRDNTAKAELSRTAHQTVPDRAPKVSKLG